MSRKDRGVIARLRDEEKNRLLRVIARSRVLMRRVPCNIDFWTRVGKNFDDRGTGVHNLAEHPLAIREWWRERSNWALRILGEALGTDLRETVMDLGEPLPYDRIVDSITQYENAGHRLFKNKPCAQREMLLHVTRVLSATIDYSWSDNEDENRTWSDRQPLCTLAPPV